MCVVSKDFGTLLLRHFTSIKSRFQIFQVSDNGFGCFIGNFRLSKLMIPKHTHVNVWRATSSRIESGSHEVTLGVHSLPDADGILSWVIFCNSFSTINFIGLVLQLITIKEAMIMEDHVGLYGIVGFFAVIVVFSGFYSYFLMPETFGLSLQVIN